MSSPERSTFVSVIGLLYCAAGVIGGLLGLVFLIVVLMDTPSAIRVFIIITSVFGPGSLALAVGLSLQKRRHWSRLVAMILSALSIASTTGAIGMFFVLAELLKHPIGDIRGIVFGLYAPVYLTNLVISALIIRKFRSAEVIAEFDAHKT